LVRMSDVAEAANVSTATVSRVLSGTEGAVRDETATLVRETAQKLGYRYNAVAASLRRQQTRTLGIVIPRVSNPFFSLLTEQIERRLSESDTALIITDSQQDPQIERDRVNTLIDRRVDGLILIPTAGSESAQLAESTGVPTVLLDLVDAGPNVDTIGVEHDLGTREIIRHLYDQGHHRIAFIGGTIALSPAARRLDGYLKSVAEQDRTDVLLGNFTMEWGYNAGSQLDPDLDTTAVVCANDLIAYGLLQWAQEQNINVPGQLAITGFDDLPFSAVTAPPLTTVRQPVEQLAEETLNLLTQRVGQPGLPKREVRLRGQVIVRSST